MVIQFLIPNDAQMYDLHQGTPRDPKSGSSPSNPRNNLEIRVEEEAEMQTKSRE